MNVISLTKPFQTRYFNSMSSHYTQTSRFSHKLFLLVLTFSSLQVYGQKLGAPKWFLLQSAIQYNINGGDWKGRYPAFTSVPLSVEYFHRHKYVVGVNYDVYLGSQVEENGLYGQMVNNNNQLLDQNGYPAVVRTYMRGFQSGVHALKSFPFKAGSNWHLQMGGGLGYYRTHTKFVFDEDQVPQIDGNYTAGYDRLSAGWYLQEQIRIQYLNNDLVSIGIGFHTMQGSSKHLRAYDFATQTPGFQQFTDFSYGANAFITIPIRVQETLPEPDYYVE